LLKIDSIINIGLIRMASKARIRLTFCRRGLFRKNGWNESVPVRNEKREKQSASTLDDAKGVLCTTFIIQKIKQLLIRANMSFSITNLRISLFFHIQTSQGSHCTWLQNAFDIWYVSVPYWCHYTWIRVRWFTSGFDRATNQTQHRLITSLWKCN